MSDEFLKLPDAQRRAILEGADSQLGIKPSLLEKDIWICWVLKKYSLYLKEWHSRAAHRCLNAIP